MASASAALLLSVSGAAAEPVTIWQFRASRNRHRNPERCQQSRFGELPPATAFWSLTLYDLKNGFFISNDRKNYSVGENAGFKLVANGDIEIYISAKKPEGVSDENWLPITREDISMDAMPRIYAPDVEKMKSWKTPRLEMLPAAN